MSLTLSSRMLQREVAQDKKSTLENLQLLFDILETESRPEGQYGQGMVLDGRPASGRSSESRSPPGDLCLSAEKAALLVGLLDAPSTLTKSVYPVEADRLATLADLKRQAGQLAGAAAIARGLLSGVRPDDWSLHKIYLDCVCGGPAFGSNPGAENGPWEAVDSSIETISQFLEQRTQAPAVPLKADAVDPSRLRGPHLARMEWWLRRQAGPSAPPLAELHGLLLAYFRRFGSRTCFFADVRPYAEAMHRLGSRAEVAALLADLHAECRFDEDFPTAITTAATSTEAAICEPADSLGLIEMQVSYGQMVMLLDPPSAADTAASGALVVALLRKHAAARPAGIGMVVTDLHPGDDLALLASQQLTLMAVALRPRLRQRPSFRPPGSQATGAPGAVSWSGLLQLALAVAESALSHSPYHFRLRLQAIHLCGLLGLPRRAHVGSLRAYSTRSAVPKELGPNTHGRFVDTAADGHERLLQLRQVQNDTLAGHVALDYVAGAGGLSGLAGEAFASVEGVYEAAPLEVSQMVKLAIQKKSFSKVFEFVRFHRRLARSIQQHICTVEAVRGQLLTVSRSGSDHFTLQGGFGWLSSLPTATVQLSDSALYSMRDNRDTRSFADWTLAGNLHADTRVFPLRDVHWVAAYHAAYSVLHAFVPERFADLPALLDQLHQRLNAAVCARSVTWSEAVTLRLVAQLGRFMHQLSLLREADAADNTADLEATAAAIAQSLGSLHAAAAVPTCPADRLAGATLPGAGGMTLDLEQLMDFECASDRHRLSEAAAYAGYLVVSAHALVPSAPVRAGWLERHPAMAAGLAVLNDLQASLLDLVEAVARPGSDADMPAVLAPLESSAAQKALAAGLVAEAERVATSLGLAADISDAMHLPKALANVASAAADAQWSDLAQPCREYLISVHKELFQLEPLFTASR
ncbi:hypothetical protein H696_06280 [Fonticula alba]|uniref:Uncharacterized protein n=1 Tax=Fonticula alba TaxID=691883 RepID=A0A058YZ70_FONAL|nr:hypothetical protein H696_06280 [Fonticula alba]KCV67300.1 hypothetical protein H696_06280 [Fonticula alba]|eukprot:XP_009498295.1 hypothetical protein H696_06280 [Fonticula alba]